MLSPDDQELLDAATALIRQRYAVGRHHIAAALRTQSGRIVTGLHLDTYVGRASVCAEAVAVGQAMAQIGAADPITAIVSVRHPRPTEQNQNIQVVAPCGICREMLRDFAPDSRVLLADEGGALKSYNPSELLPLKYHRKP
ncbi:MAG: cytidine deaminase [Ferrovibrio sp.]|uniref:cytidine deaminase n=1 Tax=Ferrovibrio sp. TaxID=1917215 RepID=UPI0026366BE4|nr:cytidine deaminase [Ferrovibrio sp.]MCW0233162.1 cytidine deaminase [Ferrovibrio sp.]